jgi:hypothetical protein
MAFPRIEIYPRAQPLTGDEDFVISQGGVLRKTSTASVVDLTNVGVTQFLGVPAVIEPKTPVAIGPSGTLIPADAANPSNALPFVGFFIGNSTNEVRTSGLWTDLTASFTPGATYYVGIGGGITATAPSNPGAGVQVVGRAVSATQLFIQPGIVIINAVA